MRNKVACLCAGAGMSGRPQQPAMLCAPSLTTASIQRWFCLSKGLGGGVWGRGKVGKMSGRVCVGTCVCAKCTRVHMSACMHD